MKKFLSVALLIALVATMAIVANAGSGGQKLGDVAQVAADSIVIDGVKDEAYANGAVVKANCDKGQGMGNVNNSSATSYVLWDGAYLYIFTDVKDNSPDIKSLAFYMTQGWDCDCIEYFIVWDNSDCPTVQEFSDESADSLYHYRATYTDVNNGYFNDCLGNEGFGNGAEGGTPFSDEPGLINNGFVKPNANGYTVEMKIKLATTDKKGAGSYTYGDGTKIGFCVHFFDFWGDFSYGNMTILYTDPTGDTKADSVMKSAWQVKDYWYLELKGEAAATDAPATDAPATDAPATDAPATDAPATDAPATDAPATDAPATDAPATQATTKAPTPAAVTSDVAVAGLAILATLAVAGVVVAKKVR